MMGCTSLVELLSKTDDIDARIVVNLAAAGDLKMIDYPLPKTIVVSGVDTEVNPPPAVTTSHLLLLNDVNLSSAAAPRTTGNTSDAWLCHANRIQSGVGTQED